MKGELLIGMTAGIMVGAVACAIAFPYIQPELDRIMKKGKKAFSDKVEEMTE